MPCPAISGSSSGVTQPGGRFDAKATTIKFLLEWAYDLQPAQHSDGPAWFSSDRYDIAAKAEGNASDATAIRESMSGNLCRCAAYPHIVAAIIQARDTMRS